MLFVEARELPMFDLRLTFAAGSSQDGDAPGLALLTNAMLNEGVAGKDVSAIAQGFESLGADFGNGAYRDMAVASLRSLSAADKREPALKLFAEVVGKPTFPADSFARIKNQMLAGFEYQKQNPGKLAGLELMKRLYGDHPYAHSSDGTADSIPPITLAQARAFHAKAYAAGNAVIALVGDLSRAEAEAVANQVSAALPKGPALAKNPATGGTQGEHWPHRIPVQADQPDARATGHRPRRSGLCRRVPGQPDPRRWRLRYSADDRGSGKSAA
nr:hypothetical protein GCM10020185_38280 [Pseudomonas brassicacearum subsp. brassicacearum]